LELSSRVGYSAELAGPDLESAVPKERPIGMQVSLFYNEDAVDVVSLYDIRELLERHGHQLVHHVERDSDAERLLDEPSELVAVAGGDGTRAAPAVAHARARPA